MSKIANAVLNLKDLPQPEDKHPEGDCLNHTFKVLENLPLNHSRLLFTAAILHDIGKTDTLAFKNGKPTYLKHAEVGAERARQILLGSFSEDEINHICDLIRLHMVWFTVKEWKPKTVKKYLSIPLIQDHLDLHRADLLASTGDLSTWEFLVSQLNK